MVSQEQIEEMVALRQDLKLPLASIGDRFGVTAERVRQILRAQNVDTRRIPKIPIDVKSSRRLYDWDEIVRLHVEEQKSSYDIAVMIDGNPTYIRQGLANRGKLRSQKAALSLKRRQLAAIGMLAA